MKRLRGVWLLFFLGVALVVAAMTWASRTVWELERAERRAKAQAVQDENVRLALWRSDSALTPLLAIEANRLAAHLTVARRGQPVANAVDNSPSDDSAWRLLDFQFHAAGARTVLPVAATADAPRRPSVQLGVPQIHEELQRVLPPLVESPLPQANPQPELPTQQAQTASNERTEAEFGRRSQAVAQNRLAMLQNQETFVPAEPISTDILFEPLWIGEQLFLARRAGHAGRESIQGCLLDWPFLRQSLLRDIKDLLPQAQLEAAPNGRSDDAYRLAALPVRLLPGPLPEASNSDWGPAMWSLVAAWAALGLAAAAVAALLVGVVRLSERRATFVSAVTHELRTPLTTFQLYSEMLAAGMVPESERPHYLQTLQQEAERLTHLVENVLAYARLERGRTSAREEATAATFLEPFLPRLAAVAARTGMELVVEIPASALASRLSVNRSSLEQILLNLVDNAAKYAAAASDKRIHLTATVTGDAWELRVWDHGPGLAAARRPRWFRPFSRSAQEAAGSAPGVGLGLALSRRLARDMGGRLTLDSQVAEGACFVLQLPCG